jgi:hypothetical protein
MRFVVYEKARWHLEGDWPEGLPDAQAYVIGGMLLGWLSDRDLLSEEFIDDNRNELAQFRDRKITAARLFQIVDGVLTSEDVTAAVRDFLG